MAVSEDRRTCCGIGVLKFSSARYQLRAKQSNWGWPREEKDMVRMAFECARYLEKMTGSWYRNKIGCLTHNLVIITIEQLSFSAGSVRSRPTSLPLERISFSHDNVKKRKKLSNQNDLPDEEKGRIIRGS